MISVDTFAHFADWTSNLDEFLRVTSPGGRIIVDVGSRDHLDAVAAGRACAVEEVEADDFDSDAGYGLRLSCAELREYAAERSIALVALVPSGAALGSLVPNHWIGQSYVSRSGGIDRLVSWIGADDLLFAFAEFIERRIVQHLPPSMCGRMFAVFERDENAQAYQKPLAEDLALYDERGPAAWRAEFKAHAQHAPNRAFAVAFILAAWPIRLPAALRGVLPVALLRELDQAERASYIDDVAADVVAAWRAGAKDVAFHGVDLRDVLGTLLQAELRGRFEANE